MSWDSANIALSQSLKELQEAQGKLDQSAYDTPVLSVVHDARERTYDVVCLPLTNENWRERWRSMCVIPVGQMEGENSEAERRAETWRANPCFLRDEVTMSRLGECTCNSNICGFDFLYYHKTKQMACL